MRVLVTGVNGQLGHDVLERLAALSIPARGVDLADFDLTDEKAVLNYVTGYAPGCIVHCAAYTAVDKAEENQALAKLVNVDGTRNIARAAAQVGAKIVYISTDYVFPGTGDRPWKVSDETAPCNFYGFTKLEGEKAVSAETDRHFIIRISWAFGTNGHNFVKTMLRLGAEKERISVVDDQIGSPTYTFDLARLICDMIQTDKFGLYHATNEGTCSWYEFASAIMARAGRKAAVIPVSSEEYAKLVPTAAARPKNSRLDKSSLDAAGFTRLPSWQAALDHYLAAIGELKNQ